jgi:hypothetical protein
MPSSYHTAIGIGLGVGFSLVSMAAAQTVTDPRLMGFETVLAWPSIQSPVSSGDTENGPNSYDEINLVLPGFNSGWEQIIGPDSRDPQGLGNLVFFCGSHYADPRFSWFNPVGPTALAFLNSARLGVEYGNDRFVGDINNGNLYRFKVNAARNGFDFTSPGL